MKIAIDVRMMWSSGIGSYIRNIVPRVIDRLQGQHFYLLGKAGGMEQWQGFKRSNASWIGAESPIYTLSEQWEMAGRTPKDAGVFWSPHYNFPLMWGKKLLVTVHDAFHLAQPEFTPGFHKRLYAKFMFRRLTRRADSILCVSQFTKGELLRLAGGNAGRMRVVHNGVDDFWFGMKKGEAPHPKPYLLFVGNVKPNKNLGRLLQAFDLLRGNIPHDLVIVGQKEGFLTGDREVLRQAESFGGRVQFTGLLEERQLRQYYAFADLLVFPSLYEGFGLPPLEAMACGTPVACSNAASLPEVCGDAALYFDPFQPKDMAEKISKVLSDDPLRRELIKKGSEKARSFSWDSAASQTAKVLEELSLPQP